MEKILEVCVDSYPSAAFRQEFPGDREFQMSGKTEVESGMRFRREGVPMGLPAHTTNQSGSGKSPARGAVMGRICKCIITVVLLAALIPAMLLSAHAADAETIKPYIRKLISYYLYYQEQADEEISVLLEYIKSVDPVQGETWQKIMDSWSWTNTEMEVNTGILPDGLPQDDSLCIVVLGFGLNSNGSIKPELLDRLEVALRSAEKYPNAWIAVTGGATSNGDATEAGEMAAWLRSGGIDESRIIVEDRSLSTTQNALYTYDILLTSYPQVKQIAIVTSDYHIRWGCAMFTTVSHYRSGYEGCTPIEVISNAANITTTTSNTLYSQAWGISIIAGVDISDMAEPALFIPAEETVPETPQATESEPAPIKEGPSNSKLPAAAAALAAAAVLLVLMLVFVKKLSTKTSGPN